MAKRQLPVPILLTTANLLCGFAALIQTVHGHYATASWLIIVAAILDGLDGAAARAMHRSSRVGKQLDTIADALSFGIAPALLLREALLKDLGDAGTVFALLLLGAGVFRLARFTAARARYTGGFTGMPITAAGLTVASGYLYFHKWSPVSDTPLIWFGLVVLLALAMVSRIPYRKFPLAKFGEELHPAIPVVTTSIVAAAILFKPAMMLFPVMLLYVITAPLAWAFQLIRQQRTNVEEQTEEDNDEVAKI